jgi:tetratricopeptide (TPR) repeat protein
MNRNLCFVALLVAALVNGLALSRIAASQDTVARDYYLAGSDRAATQALKQVELNHYGLAVKYLQNKQYRYAQNDLEFILKYFPNHPQALARMGEVALATKRPDLAEQHFRNAIGRYPQHDETHVLYGAFLHRLGRIDAAIAQYQKALEINPDSAYGNYNLGLAYVDRKNYSQANIHAQKAYELGVSFPGLRRKLQAAGAWAPLGGTGSTPTDSPSSAKQEPKAE